ncbi:MAG: HlyD family efflux transporter periplasmic adaptor subunit [Sedimentisphaerales bacterium]|nr:HlyD family efflux transporter periplasmic adaptor subunit [Sedimentisphaerales bacterium]
MASRKYGGRIRAPALPVLVFAVALVVVMGLFYHRARRYESVGIARGRVYQIAATCPGRLEAVQVRLFETVKRGQPVAILNAVLENEPLRSQLSTLTAQIEYLRSQLPALREEFMAEQTERQINYNTDHRRLDVDMELARLRILEIRTDLAEDRKLQEELNMDLQAYQELVKHGDVGFNVKERARIQYEALTKKIQENERLLEQAETDLEMCLRRRDGFALYQPYHPDPNHAMEVVRREIRIQEKLMEEIEARFEPIVLRSPIDGVIISIPGNSNEIALRRPGENILRMAGEVVNAGDPVLAVAETKPQEVVVYVEEKQMARFCKGMAVELVKHNSPLQIARSQIVEISPTMEMMPERLWLDATVPQWGRPVLVAIPPDMHLVAGESVRIRTL